MQLFGEDPVKGRIYRCVDVCRGSEKGRI